MSSGETRLGARGSGLAGRRAGALVPLFSIPSTRSWGIGEMADVPAFAQWLRRAGLSVLQLLPLNEMGDGQTSPYSALSAMALDPIFIALEDVPEFHALGGEASLDGADRKRLATARAARSVDYATVRDLKNRVLRQAFDEFVAREWRSDSARAGELRRFLDRQRWWIADYALYRALHQERSARHWIEWEPALRTRDRSALEHARARLEYEVLFRAWLQWLADVQWRAARAQCEDIAIVGDFPFMVSGDSADVWARQEQFRLDASVGVPPDAFSETGQDWGLPVYRWGVIERGGDEWLKLRARRSADLFDAFRIDHLVGFYRTFVREKDGGTAFVPPDEPSQLEQGERLVSIFRGSGADVIAEDLGVVPDFVRQSLARLGVPGMKVLRWEREWEAEGRPFRDPSSYPRVSAAISGTHDTETVAEWWTEAEAEERKRASEIPALAAARIKPSDGFSPRVRDALLAALYGAGSDLVLLPLQDVFGWTDRINTPAVVAEQNWTWRLPWAVDTLLSNAEACERAEFLARLGAATQRTHSR